MPLAETSTQPIAPSPRALARAFSTSPLLISVFVVAACGCCTSWRRGAGVVCAGRFGAAVLHHHRHGICLPWAWGRGCRATLSGGCPRTSSCIEVAGGADRWRATSDIVSGERLCAGAFRFLLAVRHVLMVGTLVGLEIPLVMRILKRNTVLRTWFRRCSRSTTWAPLAVSLAFPLLLVPQLGLIPHRAAVWPDERGRGAVGGVAVSR